MQIRYLWHFSQTGGIWRVFSPQNSLILNNQVKYLGVILDSNLNWKFHIDNIIRKDSIANWQCRRAIGKTWGLKPMVVFWLYTSVKRTMLTYVALVCWKRTHPTTVKKTVWSYPADYLLEHDRLYENQFYGSNGDPPGSIFIGWVCYQI
jgi:hypothetical protein